jgi:hypothetical protein
LKLSLDHTAVPQASSRRLVKSPLLRS